MKIICKARPGPKNWAWAQARAQKLARARVPGRPCANFWAWAWAQAHFLGPGLHFHDFHIMFT